MENNNQKLEGILIDNNKSERGETLIGGLFALTGVIYSAITPGIYGFGLGAGKAPLDFRLAIPPLVIGPAMGLLGGTAIGNPGGLCVASTCAVVEGISFGAGYGLGYLLK